jgi:lysophospholipase L1-like esterase
MVPSRFVYSLFGWGIVTIVASTLGACGGSSSSDANGGSTASGGTTASGGSSSGGGGTGGADGGSGGNPSGGATGGGGGGGQACLADKYDGLVYVNYDQFNPIINSTCSGTNHQDIQGVEKLVFLGDSITVGTFPTPANQVYRELLTAKAQAEWPGVEVQSCAVNGAKTDDFFSGDNQIPKCFPGPEQKKTLIVITMGGNDLKDIAQKKDTLSIAEAQAMADQVVANMKDAVTWLKDPTNFPNGSYVVFANVYEYTDLTGDLSSCPLAQTFAGLSGDWAAGMTVLGNSREGYMKVAVDTQSDMIFLGESFCGHGYHFNDTTGQCYEAGATNWFDLTCIHPTPEGHGHLADLFWNTITE